MCKAIDDMIEDVREETKEQIFCKYLRNMLEAGFTFQQMMDATNRTKEDIVCGLKVQGLIVPD